MLLGTLLAVALAGSTWEGPEPGLLEASSIVAAADDHTVYAFGASSSSDAGIFRSADGGASWEKVADQFPAEFFTGLWADPFDAQRLIAATEHAGFAFFTLRLYRSVDGGASWTLLTQDIGGPGVFSVAFDASRPGTLYVGVSAVPALLRSDDGGDSFATLVVPFAGAQLRVAPDSDVLAAASLDVWKSHDRGEHWSRLPTPQTSCPAFTALAIDPTDSDRLFLGTGIFGLPCGGVLRSLDGGQTWTQTSVVDGPVNDLWIDRLHPGFVYAATFPTDPSPVAGRVLLSGDDGASWRDLGLPSTTGASSLALPEGGRRLYAATPNGVYARDFRRTVTLEAR